MNKYKDHFDKSRRADMMYLCICEIYELFAYLIYLQTEKIFKTIIFIFAYAYELYRYLGLN